MKKPEMSSIQRTIRTLQERKPHLSAVGTSHFLHDWEYREYLKHLEDWDRDRRIKEYLIQAISGLILSLNKEEIIQVEGVFIASALREIVDDAVIQIGGPPNAEK